MVDHLGVFEISYPSFSKHLTWCTIAEWFNALDWELRSKVVGSIPSHASNFTAPNCKTKQHVTTSQGISSQQ